MNTKAALNTIATEIENKIPDIRHFLNAQEFNRLTKISFNARMKGAVKGRASTTEVNNALNLGDKNQKIKTSNIQFKLFLS